MSTKLNPEIIVAAIEGFENQKDRLDAQIGELRAMLNGRRTESAAAEPPKRKRQRISAASRKRIAKAQRKRWAATKQQSAPSLQILTSEAQRKRRLSAAGRKRIIEATKRRWALKRAELEQAQRASAKKGSAGKGTAKKSSGVGSDKSVRRVLGPAELLNPVANDIELTVSLDLLQLVLATIRCRFRLIHSLRSILIRMSISFSL